jgi:hypothetical protein
MVVGGTSSYSGSGPICDFGRGSTVELRTPLERPGNEPPVDGPVELRGEGLDNGGTVDSVAPAGSSVVTVARDPQFVQGTVVEPEPAKIGRYDWRLCEQPTTVEAASTATATNHQLRECGALAAKY